MTLTDVTVTESWIMTGISTVQRLTAAELHLVAPDDVMVISETRGGAIAAWALGGGLAFAAKDDYSGEACWLSVVGDPDVSPMLVDAALADLGDQIAGVTVPRGVDLARWHADPAPGHETDSDWDLMATWTPPPAQPARSTATHAPQRTRDRTPTGSPFRRSGGDRSGRSALRGGPGARSAAGGGGLVQVSPDRALVPLTERCVVHRSAGDRPRTVRFS